MQFWSGLPLPAGPNQMPPFMLTRLIFPLSVMACPFVFFRFCVYWAVFPKLEPTRNNSSLGLPSGVTRCTTCLSSICIRGSVITKIGMPSASQITRLCSKLKNLPWHWNTTSGDESERTSTGIDEPEHPDAYWIILMHPDSWCILMHPICQLLFETVYYSKSHGTSLRYQKAQYRPQRAPTVFPLLESRIL